MIDIILMEPVNPGNVGAVARVMKNFGFSNLILINSQCNHLDETALARAKHAGDILKKAKVKQKSYLKTIDYLVGTTAVKGTDYNIPRIPLTPKEFAEKVKSIKKKVGLLLGREGPGLTNEEIQQCDFIVTIPTSPKYATMNISHSLAILLYELFEQKSHGHIVPISQKEKEVILKKIDHVLERMDFSTPEKKETQRRVWKRIIGKSMLSKREAFALMGFLRKLEK